jgi:hypothetical protein
MTSRKRARNPNSVNGGTMGKDALKAPLATFLGTIAAVVPNL